jgi:hypothetical protein
MSTLSIFILIGFAFSALLSAALICCIRSNNKRFAEAGPVDRSSGTDLRRREVGSDKLSLEAYYRPMRHMLDPIELERARTMERISPAHFKEFRVQRIQAFRTYLGDLKVDFRRLEFKLRYMVLAGTAEDADLVIRLNKLKAQFGLGMLLLELRLVAFQLGVGSVEISALLDGIQQLERALEPQRPLAAAAGA